jgi:hypothetical protein
MGTAKFPSPVKIFVAITFNCRADIDRVLTLVDSKFGSREDILGPISFDWTEYYSDEMGSGLLKYYIIYKNPVERERLADLKLFTNDLESRFVIDNRRMVNIDPGYLAKDKLALATTKDFYHRLYLGKGIYAEVTLHYRKGRYRYFSWTYPDFKEADLHRFLEKPRASLVKYLRDLSKNLVFKDNPKIIN